MTVRYRPRSRSRSTAIGLAASIGLLALGALWQTRIDPGAAALAQSGLQKAYRLVDTWEGTDLQSAAGAVLYPAGLDATENLLWVVDAGNDRVEAFGWDGVLRLTFGRRGSAAAELDDPRDLAVDGQRVYVLDRGNRRVSVFGLDGQPIAQWSNLGLDAPWGIAAGAGRVYVSEPSAGEVLVVDEGRRIATWQVDGQPMGLDLGPDGKLRVARSAAGLVSTYGADGSPESDLVQPNPDLAPLDVSVDDDGGLYVQSRRAILWYEAGSAISRQAMYRDGLVGVTHWPRKGVVGTVVDEPRTWHGLIAFAWRPRDGERIWDWPYLGFPPGRLNAPSAVQAGADGRIYVLDGWPRIQAFAPDGRLLAQRVPSLAPARRFEPVDIAVSADGAMLVAEPRHITQLAPDGTTASSLRLQRGTTELWGTAIALRGGGDRVTLLDSAQATTLDYGVTQTLRPIGGYPLQADGSPWQLWWDLAAADADPDGRIYLAQRTTRRVAAYAAGLPVGGWALEGIPIRLAVGPAGTVFVLLKGGIVQEHAPDGRILAAWDAGAVSATADSDVVDLTVDADGRVYTVDRAAGTLRVWAVDPDALPEPPARRGDGCRLRGDKRAAPARVVLGDVVTVTLSIGGDCPSASAGADIVLAIDRSYSMQADGKITATIAAALDFVNAIDLSEDRVAVLAFNNKATLAQPLTADRAAARRAIEGLSPLGGTNIAAALQLAADELGGANGRRDADRVIVLLTDGKDDDPVALLAAADRAKTALGARIFTIGFGDVDPMVMVRAASSPEDSYQAPDSSALSAIYAEIARRLSATVLASQMEVRDRLPDDMRFVAAVAGPQPSQVGRELVWNLVDLPFGGIDLAYTVEPQALGRHATNVEARATYRDGLDEPGEIRFPVPEVDVLDQPPPPTLTPTAFPTPTPKPPPTRTPLPPEPIFLPLILWQKCLDREVRADVVLVTDTSGSMNLPAAGDGGPTRLEAAVDAAERFVTGLLERQSGNRVALVSFNRDAQLVQPLTEDLGAVRQTLAGLSTVTGTRIDLGIAVARDELTGERGDATRNRVMVLLTDGRVSDVTDLEVVQAADAAKAEGILLLAIGLGDAADVDFDLLRAVASRPDLVFQAPSAAQLAAIYAQIAYTIECPNLSWP